MPMGRLTKSGWRCCWRSSLAAVADAQRAAAGSSNRIATPTPESFDGRFNFCRIAFSGSSMGDGGGWSVDYPRADINLSIRLSELTKTRISTDAVGRAEPPGGAAHRSRAVPVPVHHDDRGRQGVLQSGRGAEAARVPAEGRLPLGRRLLGQLRVGALGIRVQQGAAAGRVPDARPAAGSSAVPHASSRSTRCRRFRRSTTGRATAVHVGARRRQRSAARARHRRLQGPADRAR